MLCSRERSLPQNTRSRPKASTKWSGRPRTNCGSQASAADGLPSDRFTALTRLDENRARAQLALALDAPVASITRVPIWGNHSATQFPDITHAMIDGQPIADALAARVGDVRAWQETEFIPRVAGRGAEIIDIRGSSSVASAASAAIDHVRDWVLGTDDWTSAGVVSHGEYGVPEGLISSFPVQSVGGEWHIVEGLELDDWARARVDSSIAELIEERNAVRALDML